ncbi:MAG: alpha-galactosidase, partial [Bacilli bacterium]|nr:alpha-galactosidase [Bacilli bacterium]
MIYFDEEQKVFHIQTNDTSYIMQVLHTGHLASLYYGAILDINSGIKGLRVKHGIEVGGQVIYQSNDKTFNLNLEFLELPTYGKGDFREPMVHIRLNDGSRLTEFKYKSHTIGGKPIHTQMPETKANDKNVETLIITMEDIVNQIEIDLHYAIFYDQDIIARRALIRNQSKHNIMLEKALSMNLDLFDENYQLTTFDGAWIRERMIHKRKLSQGIIKIDSKKGVSSSDHNPFVVLSKDDTN